jgi:proteasome lid subunit RPN8/RPN11
MNVAIAVLLSIQMSVAASACTVARGQVLPLLGDLLQASRSAQPDTERAMFLTRTESGDISAQLWPATRQRRQATFTGTMPANAVAIAHTHPHNSPQPSAHDIEEAARLQLPIYVVTRTSITRVDPDRTTTALVAHTDWFADAHPGAGRCEAWATAA